jgi:3-hydroxymyristoyl/3-hydroxydecanoyl-(acyl carrier protein) dehydratase
MIPHKKNKIKNLIKISGKLLMIDEITSFEIKEKIYTEKKLSKNEWFYKIHLTNRPVMPGILQSEAMQQSIVSLLYLDVKYKNFDILIFHSKNTFFSEINGSQSLKIISNIVEIKEKFIKARSVIKIKDKIMSKGEFTFIVVKNKKSQLNAK